MNRGITVFFLFLSCLLFACDPAQTGDEPSALEQGKIQWFEGNVEQAFATAADVGKPVFLYWGAEWCPPCHNLKINYFTRPAFIDAIQRFVPVYLDGDTVSAQLWAEKFGITGYPSVILFSPTGVELFRMPSDVTPEQYGTLLQASISNFRPVHQILSEVIEGGPQAVSQLDQELLAYHSWVQDPHSELSDDQALDVFWKLFSETREGYDQLKARFMVLTLERAMPRIGAVQALQRGGSISSLTDPQREALHAALVELLRTPDLWPENKIFLTLQSRQAIAALEPEASPGRDELVESWVAASSEMQNHPQFSATEQLMAFVPEFELLAFRGEDAVPERLRDKVRVRVDKVVADTSDPGEFQSTLNMAVWLLTMAQLPDEAEAVLDQHMDQTAAPHYFISILGNLAADRPEAALEWHRQAFEHAAHGSARIKWGSAYVLSMIQLAPADADAIETAARELITELATSDDAFAGRNNAYIQQVDQVITDWAAATGNDGVIERLRTIVLEQCDRFGSQMDPVQFERCKGFLNDD